MTWSVATATCVTPSVRRSEMIESRTPTTAPISSPPADLREGTAK
jgi:hypothetical protein